ncbi:MAG: hypothetical protein C4290_12015 [Chloroflexota bacterium]
MTSADEAAHPDPVGTPLDREEEARLHQRLLTGDPTVSDAAAHVLLPRIYAALRRRRPEVRDEHLLEEAAATAILEYLARPDKYDPSKLPLTSYLVMAADRDLLNLLQRERRHQLRVVSLDDVEHAFVAWNDEQDDADAIELPPGLTREQVLQALRDKVQDERDRQVLYLMVVVEERRTEVYARVLGIEHLPWPEQRREVKRVKDRITKALRRLGEELRGY